MTYLIKKENVAVGVSKGTPGRKCMRKVVCLFDDETFDAIRSRAIAKETSFAEQIRLLVEWGLEA
jgi:hypothetical protein